MTTKRPHGPCTCVRGVRTLAGVGVVSSDPHRPDCPSLYPAQQESDALTRLVRHIRSVDTPPQWREEALSLISEAREERRKARDRAAQTAGDTAAAWDDKNGGIDAKTGPRIAAICKAIRGLDQ